MTTWRDEMRAHCGEFLETDDSRNRDGIAYGLVTIYIPRLLAENAELRKDLRTAIKALEEIERHRPPWDNVDAGRIARVVLTTFYAQKGVKP